MPSRDPRDFTINSRVRDVNRPEREGAVCDVSFVFGPEVKVFWDDVPPMTAPDWQARTDVERVTDAVTEN